MGQDSDGLFGILTRGIDTWGQVATAKAAAKAELYTRSATGTELYPVGAPQLSGAAQAATGVGSTLLVVGALAAAAVVVALILKG